uniref:Glabrous enhancer-binding protein-like DBD domain-containing protein n=1 Tax=Daucus carota subsp. sativus TaxID=79200 RepID=A0A175YF63_DAUCS
MARKQRSPPATISRPLQNDAVEQHAASSESDISSVKRTGTPDSSQKSGSKPDLKRSRKRGSEKDDKGARVSVNQLKKKIKTLNRKYKSLKDSDAVFAKPMEEELFRLSYKVWGQGNDNQGNDDNKDKYMSIEINEDGVIEDSRKNKGTSIRINEDGGKEKDTSIGINEDGVNEDGDEEENEGEGLGIKKLYPNLS